MKYKTSCFLLRRKKFICPRFDTFITRRGDCYCNNIKTCPFKECLCCKNVDLNYFEVSIDLKNVILHEFEKI